MATNLAAIAAAATAGAVVINWTAVIAIVTVCLTAMATLIRLYGPKSKVSDEILRGSPYLKKLEDDAVDGIKKLNALKEYVQTEHTEVEKLKIETKNSTKSLEELKQDNRDLVQRLDDLLKQFMEYMEG